MATWVTHLWIADIVLAHSTGLDRHGFCVGNIAPDCNVENADWTVFTPSREVTHFMQGPRKGVDDGEVFYEQYIASGEWETTTAEHLSFLAGYYAHLIVDAAFQRMIRDPNRVCAVWERIHAEADLRQRVGEFPEDWDTVKKLIPKQRRMEEIYTLEAAYLQGNPGSGYLTEILPLQNFPDYMDFLPRGCIVRKIGVMGYLPRGDVSPEKRISISEEEYLAFVRDVAEEVTGKLAGKKLCCMIV